MQQALSFDDVLLVPKYSDIESRKHVDISSAMDAENKLELPVFASPMDTVSEVAMANAMSKHGGAAIIHRYNTIEEQADLIGAPVKAGSFVGAAIGVTGDYLERAAMAREYGASFVCVDVAHGHHSMMKRALAKLREVLGDSYHIMAGNVATCEGFDAVAAWGADSIRVGIGGGSICSTRLVSGHGIPTLASVLDCSRSTHDAKIIADGGIKTTGDMVKAFAAGADFVMVGSMLAGTKESPGEVLSSNSGKKFKVYRGMASSEAQNDWRGKSSTAEGVSTTVPYKGSVEHILNDIAGGIKSGLSYTGARTMAELRAKSTFIRQTAAGQVESSTHIMRRY